MTLPCYFPALAITQDARALADVTAAGETLSPGVLPLLDYLGPR